MKNIKAMVLIAVFLTFSVAFAKDEGCVHFVNETAAYISSSNSVECIWNLEANYGEIIKLTFQDFHLLKANENGDCTVAYVALYDGSTENDPLLGKFCGGDIPPPIISTNRRMLVAFKTDTIWVNEGFIAHYVRESSMTYFTMKIAEISLKQLLLETRRDARSIDKWGTFITRIAVALFLNNKQFFAPGDRYGEEIAYELSLQLLSKLALKKSISTKDLALYINALTVACFDPKDFFGINFVEELRKRENVSNNTNPFSLLTLCTAKDAMTVEDALKLQDFYDSNVRPVWTDAQAMAVMALSCIHSRSELNFTESILNRMVSELKRKQHKNGTIDNWKTTALVLQALIAAEDYDTDFNFSAAVKFLLEGVSNHSNIPDIYYILPILSDRSLADINSDHCETFFKTEGRNSLLEQPAERIQVQISVIVGNDMDFYHTWKVKVLSNYSFYQVLEKIGTMEHSYKAHYSVSEGKPYVVGFANFMDSAEDGSYWYIYSRPLSSPGHLKLIEMSPVDITVNETDEMILWYRSGFWVNSEEGSGE